MKQTPLLLIGFFLITITAVGQDITPKLDSLQSMLNKLEQEVQAIDKKVSEIKNEISHLSGTTPGTIAMSPLQDDRFTELAKRYGPSDATLIQNKGYRIGMSKAMLQESLGSPLRQSASRYGSYIQEDLHYKLYDKRIHFVFEDEILVSFMEL